MVLFIKLLGVLIILAGIAVLINPTGLYSYIESSLDHYWLYITAIILRASMGLLLIAAAKQSKFPVVIKFIGYVTVLAAIVFLLIGQTKFQEFMSSMMDTLQPVTWMSGLLAAAFGTFLIYSFTNVVDRFPDNYPGP